MQSPTAGRERQFKTYLVNQGEPEEKDYGLGMPSEETASWKYVADPEKEPRFHTVREKVKRFFA